MVLPALVLSTGMAALLMRLSHAVMLEALAEAHVTAARARALAEARLVLIHALKRAASPPITVTGGYFDAILGGSVIVEVITARAGGAWDCRTAEAPDRRRAHEGPRRPPAQPGCRDPVSRPLPRRDDDADRHA